MLSRAAEVFDRCRKAYEEYEFHVVYHRILDLCTVVLSSLYLDMSKDTLYCEAPASPTRRSAQTAMYEILRGLVSYLAPILSFTAEEIYEAMPGTKEQSVHLTDFPTITAPAIDSAAWERIFRVREAVSKVLEAARAAGTIGQSLEADVQLHGVTREALVGSLDVDLAKVFIVSHVDFVARRQPTRHDRDRRPRPDRHHHVARPRQKVRTLLAVPRGSRRRRRPVRAMR